MSTSRAAVLESYGAPLEVRELERPDPEPNALVVEVAAATICGTDIHLWNGGLAQLGVELPVVPGHEAVGRVLAIGEGADRDSMGVPLSEGDRVVWTHGACGHCRSCSLLRRPTLCTNRKVGMNHRCDRFPYVAGTFAQTSYVWPEAGRVRVPDEVPDAWASASSCALRSAVQFVEAAGTIRPTDSVVVQGAGPLGLLALALLSLQNPRNLILIGGPQERLAVGSRWGATHVLDIAEYPTPEARLAAVADITDGVRADVIFEMSGAPGAFAETVEMAALGARCVISGAVSPPAYPVPAHLITVRGLSVIGTFGAEIDAYWKGLEFMRAYGDRFDVGLLLGNEYGLDEVDLALQQMVEQREIKPIIRPAP
jgi:D-arabinose 1-dehydrogenase-like Zn-dependent alcohol dehydrogenase